MGPLHYNLPHASSSSLVPTQFQQLAILSFSAKLPTYVLLLIASLLLYALLSFPEYLQVVHVLQTASPVLQKCTHYLYLMLITSFTQIHMHAHISSSTFHTRSTELQKKWKLQHYYSLPSSSISLGSGRAGFVSGLGSISPGFNLRGSSAASSPSSFFWAWSL